LCCTPTTTCASANAVCGTIDDGCGFPLVCGSCQEGLICAASPAGRACVKPANVPAIPHPQIGLIGLALVLGALGMGLSLRRKRS
jgi:hypothetical protein